MKIVLFVISLTLSLFAQSDLEKSYADLNSAIDTIAKQSTLKEKISLYYLALATHDQLFYALYKKETSNDDLQETKKSMLRTIVNLKQNKAIAADAITQLRNRYAHFNQEAKKLLYAQQEPQTLDGKTLYEQTEKTSYVKTVLIAFTLFFMLLSAILAYLLYRSHKTNVSKENFPMIDTLLQHQTQL